MSHRLHAVLGGVVFVGTSPETPRYRVDYQLARMGIVTVRQHVYIQI